MPGGLAGETAGQGDAAGSELPTRPLSAPTTPPAPYGGGGGQPRPAAEPVVPGIPQTRYGRPSVSEPATEPFGAAQQVPPPAATPPAAPIAGGGGALPSRAARSEVVPETSILAGPSFDGFSAGRRGVREEETEAFHHPARQSGPPSRPRHAAQSETGEHPTVGTGDDGATSRFTPMRATDPVQGSDAGPDVDAEATTRIGPVDPDVTTRLGAPSAAEQAERRAAFARGEAERRANAQAELERLAAERAAGAGTGAGASVSDSPSGSGTGSGSGDDEPPTSPWAAPPRDRT
ncbi:hypothetical protein GCM10010532_022590 [Dactylosporangium siamense]